MSCPVLFTKPTLPNVSVCVCVYCVWWEVGIVDAHIHEHIVCLLLEVGLVDACVHEHGVCVCVCGRR